MICFFILAHQFTMLLFLLQLAKFIEQMTSLNVEADLFSSVIQ